MSIEPKELNYNGKIQPPIQMQQQPQPQFRIQPPIQMQQQPQRQLQKQPQPQFRIQPPIQMQPQKQPQPPQRQPPQPPQLPQQIRKIKSKSLSKKQSKQKDDEIVDIDEVPNYPTPEKMTIEEDDIKYAQDLMLRQEEREIEREIEREEEEEKQIILDEYQITTGEDINIKLNTPFEERLRRSQYEAARAISKKRKEEERKQKEKYIKQQEENKKRIMGELLAQQQKEKLIQEGKELMERKNIAQKSLEKYAREDSAERRKEKGLPSKKRVHVHGIMMKKLTDEFNNRIDKLNKAALEEQRSFQRPMIRNKRREISLPKKYEAEVEVELGDTLKALLAKKSPDTIVRNKKLQIVNPYEDIEKSLKRKERTPSSQRNSLNTTMSRETIQRLKDIKNMFGETPTPSKSKTLSRERDEFQGMEEILDSAIKNRTPIGDNEKTPTPEAEKYIPGETSRERISRLRKKEKPEERLQRLQNMVDMETADELLENYLGIETGKRGTPVQIGKISEKKRNKNYINPIAIARKKEMGQFVNEQEISNEDINEDNENIDAWKGLINAKIENEYGVEITPPVSKKSSKPKRKMKFAVGAKRNPKQQDNTNLPKIKSKNTQPRRMIRSMKSKSATKTMDMADLDAELDFMIDAEKSKSKSKGKSYQSESSASYNLDETPGNMSF